MLWQQVCLQCRRRTGQALCPSCWEQIEPLSAPCTYCSLPLAPVSSCSDCPRLPLKLHHRAYTLYEGPIQNLLYQLKYHQRPALGLALGDYLGQWLKGSRADALIPIPLHPERLASRGYNQAELIAKGISQRLHIPVVLALERQHNTEALHGLSLAERRIALEKAFALSDSTPKRLQGKTVLVVDDIFTTGATLSEAYQALQPWARAIGSVSLARTQSHTTR